MSPLRGVLQSELEEISDGVTQMGDLVERALLQAVEALEDQDVELAQQVIDGDQRINQLRFEVEDLCFTVLATQQPVAGDLRTIVTALNIITDLERMGDYAKGIGQIVIRMGGEDLFLALQTTPHMARAVSEMTHSALEAFVERDVDLARQLFEMDDQVDHMYREIFESVIKAMISREQSVRKGMHLLFAAHNLERFGDRVTNICERIIFMCTGEMHEYNL
ncbi:MAG: phosphate signaling complex protein PhoU [Anaerolineae bacterium]|nr:phosphate signaling complex protein PhoU [Anaerolineae bacterium]